MKKSILNLGKQLNKTEQKNINGGTIPLPGGSDGCGWPMCRNSFGRCSLFAC